jgi:hypothetical protein
LKEPKVPLLLGKPRFPLAATFKELLLSIQTLNVIIV